MAHLEFLDESGNPLPVGRDGNAITRQYGGAVLIRVLPSAVDIELHVQEGEAYKALTPDDAGLYPFRCDRYAGVIRFYGGENGVELSPRLSVQPAHLDEQDLSAILGRLGTLAMWMEEGKKQNKSGKNGERSPVRDEVPQLRTQRDTGALDPTRAAYKRYCEFYETLKNHWPLLERLPARAIVFEHREVDASRVAARSLPAFPIQQLVQRPDRRRARVRVPVEVNDSEPNRFVAYLLQELLIRRADYLREALRTRKSDLERERDERLRFAENRGSDSVWGASRERRKKIETERKDLEKLELQVRDAQQWASAKLQSPFLRGTIARAPSIRNPSPRVTDSVEYGPLYAASRQYEREQSPTLTSRRGKIIRAVEEQVLRPVRELYEYWLFLETYAQLIGSFGFIPVGDNPLDLTFIEDGTAKLPAKEDTVPYRLLWESDAGDELAVALFYEPLVDNEGQGRKNRRESYYNPDIWLEVARGRGETHRFALDPKYYNFEEASHKKKELEYFGFSKDRFGSLFFLELLVTAGAKYHCGAGASAAYILHSDSRERYTYWGGSRASTLPNFQYPNFETIPKAEQFDPTKFTNHCYGAVYAVPANANSVFRRLLRCFFMYHMEIYNVCFSCRKKLIPERVPHKRNAESFGVGESYHCPSCQDFWVTSRCQRGHPLLKFGDESFHETESGRPWKCRCPRCGDDPGWAEQEKQLPPVLARIRLSTE